MSTGGNAVGRESMAGETSSRPTIAGFDISTRATPGISASRHIKKVSNVSEFITKSRRTQVAININNRKLRTGAGNSGVSDRRE
jgi:hypothetical protein